MKVESKKAKMTDIDRFFEARAVAIVGLSNNPKSFSWYVYKHFSKNGVKVFGVNPNHETINGMDCYRNILEVPDEVESVYIVTPKDKTLGVLKDLIKRDFKQIWVQKTAENKEAMTYANEKKLPVIFGECILMFAQPVKSVHKIHKVINKVFGVHPK